MTLNRNISDFRYKAESDTGFFCRHVLDMTSSKNELTGEVRHSTATEKWGFLAEGPHQQMVDFLDDEDDPKPELRKHIEMPRGAYKTSGLQGYSMRRVLKNRDLRVLYGMETFTEALKKLRFVKEHFETNSIIREVWGGGSSVCGTPWSLSDGFTLRGRTIHQSEPSFCGFGVDKNKTGGHYDIIIPDDLVTKDNIKSPTGVESVLSTFNGLLFLLDPGGVLVPTGTRYGDSDLYGHIIDNLPRFKKLIIDCGMDLVSDEMDRVALEGTPRFKHLPKEFLEFQLEDLQDIGLFSSQYLNKCLSSAMMIFKRKLFISRNWESWMANLSCYVLTDTAVSLKDEGCYSTAWVVGLDSQDNAYVLDGIMGHWDPVQFTNNLCDLQEMWESRVTIKRTLMEKTTMNAVFKPMLKEEARRRGLRMNLVDVPRGSTDDSKHQRISRMTGRFNRGAITWISTIRTAFHDLGKTEILFDHEGYGKGSAVLPDGEIVRQFVRYPSYPKNDGADALADIDATDAKGRRICVPGSVNKENRWSDARKRRGEVIPMQVLENGKMVWVDVATGAGQTSEPESFISRYTREHT